MTGVVRPFRDRLPALLAATCVWLCAGWMQAEPAPPPALPPVPCRVAVLVAGQLRCDAAAPRMVSDLCGAAHGSTPIWTGDALEPNVLCAFRSPRRGGPGWGRMPAADLAVLGQTIDVNTAELEDLESLPRVGPAIARGIVEGRPYGGTGDLLRVKGIGPKILEGLRSRVTTEPPIIGADR